MKLSSILDPDLILINVEGNDRETIYSNMLEQASKEVELPLSINDITEGLVSREDAIKIPWEKGVALPHLRQQELDDLYIIIGILKQPIKLKDCDLAPARVIIMSLISENTSDLYLKSVSAFSRYMLTSGKLEKVTSCSSGEDFINLLDIDKVNIKKDITADDIMNVDYPYININATVSEALDLFIRKATTILPVIDDNKKLLGVLEASAIIGRSIPDYIMMMDNLNFLSSFKPFDDILKKHEELYVKDFVRDPRLTIPPETPLIQFTVKLIKGEANNAFVLNSDKQLIGVITIQELINKVLRG